MFLRQTFGKSVQTIMTCSFFTNDNSVSSTQEKDGPHSKASEAVVLQENRLHVFCVIDDQNH